MKKYYSIAIITVILYIVTYILYIVVPAPYPVINWFFSAFFAMFSITFLYIITRTMIINPKAFVRRFMALSGIKFLLGIIALALVLAFVQEYKILTALHFLIIFLLFLTLEVTLLLATLKKMNAKKRE